MFFPEEMILAHWGNKVAKKCKQCDYLFSEIGIILRMHLITKHSGEKSNNCNQCRYEFSQPDNLRTQLIAYRRVAHTNVTSDYVLSCAGDLSDTFKPHCGEQSHKCSLKFKS